MTTEQKKSFAKSGNRTLASVPNVEVELRYAIVTSLLIAVFIIMKNQIKPVKKQ